MAERRRGFGMRKLALLLGGLRRKRPRALEDLEKIEDPWDFAFAVLPHAARSFAPCILLLPEAMARPAALAYLYCRALDTCEDLGPGGKDREERLSAFPSRFGAGRSGRPAPAILDGGAMNPTDRAGLILLRNLERLDKALASLPAFPRAAIADLVSEMAAAMLAAARDFESQGGVLVSDEQLTRYCEGVIGRPIVFMLRLQQWHRGRPGEPDAATLAAALASGEFLQLANVTRDLEADLRRGVAYHPRLRPFLGRDASTDEEAMEAVREVRGLLLDRAVRLSPRYGDLFDRVPFGRRSLARASAVLMLLFTGQHYRAMATRIGRVPPGRPRGRLRMMASALSAAWSAKRAARLVEAALAACSSLHSEVRST